MLKGKSFYSQSMNQDTIKNFRSSRSSTKLGVKSSITKPKSTLFASKTKKVEIGGEIEVRGGTGQKPEGKVAVGVRIHF